VAAAGERLLDRVLCVLGAVLFAQAPEFMQQYLQRLGGRLDEARRLLGQLGEVASRSGLTVDQLASQASSNPDPALARLGDVVGAASGRVASLASAQEALAHASALTRPFQFLAHFDPSIAGATLGDFRPAVPTTLEGLIYALIGTAAFLAAYHLGVKTLIRRLGWPRLKPETSMKAET
jgi:Protein of unknown function (DUF2937)